MNSAETGKAIRKWIAVYIGALSYIVIPLYMKNGYYGLIGAKARAYRYLAIPAILVILVVAAAELSAAGDKGAVKKNNGNKDKRSIRPGTSVIILILTGAWALAASCLSQNPKLSVMGTAGWFMGSLMTAILVFNTIYISRHLYYRPYMALTVILVNVFIILFAVIQSAGADPFDFLKYIDNTQHYAYLSTIGQKNSFSGYLCLILPLFWGAFISCRERVTGIIYGAFCALGFMGIIAAESDSVYAGIGICVLFMLLYVFGEEQYVKRSSILLFMYGCCLLIVRYLPVFAGKIARFKGVSLKMIQKPTAEIICVCGILLYLWGWRLIRGKKGKYILIALEAALMIMICAYVVYTVKHFNDNWGTKRGLIWRVAWEHFLKFPVRNKITGIGPEMLVTVFPEIRASTGKNVVEAHCEPLQVLLTQGLIGLSIYIAFWGDLLVLFFKNKLWRKSAAVFFFPLAAYWGQSLFCSIYPVTAVVFSFAAGMYLKYAENAD